MPIIVDIDGTLLRNGTQPIRKVINWVNAQKGEIFIVTGRPRSDRSRTVVALRDAGIKYNRLMMNPYLPQETLKWKEEVAKRFSKSAEVAVDNDAAARAVYRKWGIPTRDPATI